MRRPFSRRKDGTIAVELHDVEVAAVARAAADMIEALDQPQVRGVARLFPPAYERDERLEQDFRRMTRDDLVASKIAAARAVLASFETGERERRMWRSVLDAEATGAWLGLLNDARLVLGTALDVTEDLDHAPLPDDDPGAPKHNLYLFLSSLEGLLVEELLEGLPEGETE